MKNAPFQPALFVLFILGIFAKILAQSPHPLDTLSAGHWYEVPNSHLEDAAPDPLPPGNIRNVIRAWSGAAYDTQRDRLLVWGGGHGDYGGNELYAFDVNTMTWSIIWGPTPGNLIPPPGSPCNETYPDGNPAARHTYDGLEYLPAPVDAFISAGGSLWCGSGSGSHATWMFDPTAGTWVRRADFFSSISVVVRSAYDPVTGHFFHAGSHSLAEFDPINNTWTVRYYHSGGWWASGPANAVIDPQRRKWVMVGNGRFMLFDLETGDYSEPPLSGDTAFLNERPGIVYDPVIESIVAWESGPDVYILDLDSMTWTRRPPAPANTVSPGLPEPRGTYGRFRYIPSRNAFILVNATDQNVFFYKLTPGLTSISTHPEAQIGTFELFQNYPNPFNPSTTIEFSLPQTASIRLEIFNTLGEKVDLLIDAASAAGHHRVVWNAGNFASGVYFYRLTVDNTAATRGVAPLWGKMLLLR